MPRWTPLMREEFRTRRGYDLAVPFLPTLAKRVVESTPNAPPHTKGRF